MKTYTVRHYLATDFDLWNDFIFRAKNATFLFHRNFMDYHSDRFNDFSLLIFDEKENLVAVLPANRVEDEVFSHQGLSYGGLVFNENLKTETILEILKTILIFLSEKNIKLLNYKTLPSIYNQKPSQEIDYLLFILQAKLVRRDSLSVIDLKTSFSYSEIRKRGIKKAIQNQLEIREVVNFDDFWNEILIPNLEKIHQVKPVHSLEEITLLKQHFPKNIRQFNVYLNNKIVAGTTIFETEKVAHAQYISANESRNEFGSLDFLFDDLLQKTFKEKAYFDFGISNENNGKNLNSGLCYWKESFGASTIIQDFYEVKTENYSLLNTVLI